MTKYILIYLLIGLLTAPLVYGMNFAYFQGEYPDPTRITRDKKDASIGAILAVFTWPTLLPISFLQYDFAHYGLRFK